MLADAQEAQAWRGALSGLAAAALFGASAPVAKLLLGTLQPTLLAALLYAGAAAGLWLVRILRGPGAETPLRRADGAKLLVIALLGGVAGPLLMLFGLTRLSGLTGSLLLNLEAPFTMLLAVLLFREHLGARSWLAALCIVGGALLLELEPGELTVDLRGMAMIAAACLCWALDNNLTQRLSLRDPFAVVRFKSTFAALTNGCLALALSQAQVPRLPVLIGALSLGCASYGLSVLLDAYALRYVGAAREAAYFATAPFLGALLAIPLLGETLDGADLLAMLVMGLGVVLMLRERHSHRHRHEAMEHEHLHVHDEHHQHAHGPDDPVQEPHAHPHRHEPLEHEHAHVSDLHHRHRH